MSNNKNQKKQNNTSHTFSPQKLRNAKGIYQIHGITKEKINYGKQFIGLSVFFIIFMLFIPISLYKTKHYTILEGYLPNLDLLATSLSWHGGPNGIWQHLYRATPITDYGFYSQVLINYASLLGLTYIIARETKRTNNIIKGWSMGFIMLLMTYLLPSNISIIPTMNMVNNYLKKLKISSSYKNRITTLFGLIVAFFIIWLESVILRQTRHILPKIGKKIINIPRLF